MGDVVWLRRDLRRADLPILGRAAESGPVTVAFVVDPSLWDPSAGSPRRRWLATTLLALRETYGGRLTLRGGDPRVELPRLATEAGASAVHISAETEPDGSARDHDVEKALGDVPLVRTGSPYAVTPGGVRTGSGGAYQRFTPFAVAWREHGWRAPAREVRPGRRVHQALDPGAVGPRAVHGAPSVDRHERDPERLPGPHRRPRRGASRRPGAPSGGAFLSQHPVWIPTRAALMGLLACKGAVEPVLCRHCMPRRGGTPDHDASARPACRHRHP